MICNVRVVVREVGWSMLDYRPAKNFPIRLRYAARVPGNDLAAPGAARLIGVVATRATQEGRDFFRDRGLFQVATGKRP